jgi:hypothetical protein
VFSLAATDVVVDLVGGFGSGFVALDAPRRIVDTRIGLGAPGGRLGAGEVVRVALPAEVVGSSGVVANVTAVAPEGGGFVSVWPCDRPRPEVSSLNYVRGEVVANAVVVRPSAGDGGVGGVTGGEVCVFSLAATDVVVDLVGGFGSGFVALDAPRRIVDTRIGLGTPGSPG